jgi:hypothetical protein
LDQLRFSQVNIFLRPAATHFPWYHTLHCWHCIQSPFKVDNGDQCAVPENPHRCRHLIHSWFCQYHVSRACGFLFSLSGTVVAGFRFSSCDCLAYILYSDDVKCVTKFLFLDVFLRDRIMLLKLTFCVSPALSLSAKFFIRNLAVGFSCMMGDVR